MAYAQIVVAANRLGKITKLSSIMEDAAYYKALALKGLRRALDCFSQENSDGVLAASISLLYQQQTPADWHRVTQGTAAVINAMRPWVRSSAHWPVLQHIHPVEEVQLPVIGVEGAFGADDLQGMPPLVTVRSVTAAVEFLLEQGIAALNRLSNCMRHRKEFSTMTRGLADMLRLAHVKHSSGQEHDPFWLAYPFCEMTNRESISFTEINSSKPLVLIVLAHTYSALVVLSILYPELDGAGFIAIRLYSLDELAKHFRNVATVECDVCHDAHSTQELLAFPWNAMRAYRQWQNNLRSKTST